MATINMDSDKRMHLLNELVEEVTKDIQDFEKIKYLMNLLGITYTEDPIQLLDNVLKGIHKPGVINEPSV